MNGPMESAAKAAEAFRNFMAASRSSGKLFYGPLYSAADLNGLAAAATRTLAARTIPFFQCSEGMTGQGFGAGRPLRWAETNLDGSPGSLPAGYGFVAHKLGVYVPPEVPLVIKEQLLRHSSLAHVRHAHRWEAGACQFWPCGEYGLQSKAVATTVANQEIQFGVNGAVQARELPEDGWLFFPPNEQIKFEITIHENINITMDGLVWNGGIFGEDPGGNGIPTALGCLLFVVMVGWRFEAATA